MSILKLANEGDEAYLQITECEVVAGQFGQQVKFTADNGDILFLPKDSADRQLGRIGFADLSNGEVIHADVANSLLRFSRTPNSKPGARPYWDISLANRGDAKASGVPSKRLTQAEASKTASPPQKPATGSFDAMMDDGDPGMPDPMTGERPLLDRIIEATGNPGIVAKREQIESAYEWAYDYAVRIQWAAYYRSLSGEVKAAGDTPHRPSADSLQAGAATLLIQAEKRGAI